MPPISLIFTFFRDFSDFCVTNVLLGKIICFFFIKRSILDLIRQLTACFDSESNIENKNCNVDLSKYIISVRETFWIHLIPTVSLEGKMMRVINYINYICVYFTNIFLHTFIYVFLHNNFVI